MTPTPHPKSSSAFGRRPSGPRRGGRDSAPRPKPEYDHKMVSIRRVARVMAGGRRFSFSVTVVAGNRQGKVGVGLGKASDTSLAIDKALNDAKKSMIQVPMTKSGTITGETRAKFKSAVVVMKPARGKGLIAGSSVRTVLELAGIKDVNAKILSRSKNKLNNARVAIKALSLLKPAKTA